MGEIRVVLQSLKMSIHTRMQYRVDSLVATLAVFIRESANIIAIYLALLKFDRINDWNVNEMLFLYSILFLTYAFVVSLFADLRRFSDTIREGRFDRLLVRPRSLLLQLILNNADLIASAGHGTLGILLFVISAGRVGIHWDFVTILYYIGAIIGGILIQGGMFIIFSSLCFYFVETNSIRDIFYWNMRKFAGYPISIYHKLIQGILIYVVPFAFVNYFPAQYLLRKEDMADYPVIYIYIAPFVGIVVYAAAYLFWRVSVKRYYSTGN
ncbi:MAG: ABC transporter permease [Lachnospiraceae bacterium]|nr:ABC transporter permease [Lachnospiraceae bacterium]MBD5483335.1 ABC transporter permease [Lachnospiraceae bacterium]